MKEKMERLETFVTDLTDHNKNLIQSESRSSLPVRDDNPSLGDDVSSQFGTLKLSSSGQTQWVGPSHWESIIDDVRYFGTKHYFQPVR